jgi:hypothetical protein
MGFNSVFKGLSLNSWYEHHCHSHYLNRPITVRVQELLDNQVKPHQERYSGKYFRISTNGDMQASSDPFITN